MGNPIQFEVLLHADGQVMYENGSFLGLTGEALSNFSHALSEVKCVIDVYPNTGRAELVSVNNIRLIGKTKC